MDDVTIEGKTKAFTRTTGEQGIDATFNFCPECGTSIWWGGRTEGESPLVGYYGIAGGCFADPDFPPPTHSLYERTRHTWINSPEGTPCFSGTLDDPGAVAEFMARLQESG
jgi:hypothetical protein